MSFRRRCALAVLGTKQPHRQIRPTSLRSRLLVGCRGDTLAGLSFHMYSFLWEAMEECESDRCPTCGTRYGRSPLNPAVAWIGIGLPVLTSSERQRRCFQRRLITTEPATPAILWRRNSSTDES